VRIRKRGQNGHWSYTVTTRQPLLEGEQLVETRMQITKREYERYRQMRDPRRVTICKRRRCFNFGSQVPTFSFDLPYSYLLQYFHLDIYVRPLPPLCGTKQLMILETYTTTKLGDVEPQLPGFVGIDREITGDLSFSMYNLSKMQAAAALPNGTSRQSSAHSTPTKTASVSAHK
jgi:hypothetical protein